MVNVGNSEIPVAESRRLQCDAEFLAFNESEIEQSISARFEQQVRKYGGRMAVSMDGCQATYADTSGLCM